MRKNISSAKDVAKAANVSQSTVSRVFTPGASVSAKTKAKILKVANKLNYQPNALARGLITKQTNMVGVAMKDIQNPFYHEILGLITNKLRNIGYTVMFVYTENETIQQEEINHFLEFNVAGVIVTDALLASDVVVRLSDNNIPITLINRYDASIPCNSVYCDNTNAARTIATFMYDAGARDIVYISGGMDTSTNRDRQAGFTEFFRNKNIEVTILDGNFTYEKAFFQTKKLIETGHIPEAIFGANDITALGALDALKFYNISVPEETIVIGFDNIKMAAWPSNLLSTWAQPTEEMVDAAIDMLLGESKNKQHQKEVMFQGEFIQRSTSL